VTVSYDLYFRSRSPSQKLSLDEFTRHFSGRPLYKVTDSQAWYSNEDSGVYFFFKHVDRGKNCEPEDEPDLSMLPVAFNLNYFRPHVFGLEAEPEVAAFIKRFDLTVSDPQTSGIGDGEYSKEGFLRGWNSGNELGYRAILSQDATPKVLTLPASEIESYWRWNYRRDARQSEMEYPAFVPRIFFFDMDGVVRTGVAWGDGIPILLPRVDLVLVPRKQLAPRRGPSSREDVVVFTWAELEPALNRFRRLTDQPRCYELFYGTTPSYIEQMIREKRPPDEMPKGVSLDQLLDRELVEKHRPLDH
jgi:hypothetical protein